MLMCIINSNIKFMLMCVGKQIYLVRISIPLHVCAIPNKSDKYYSSYMTDLKHSVMNVN